MLFWFIGTIVICNSDWPIFWQIVLLFRNNRRIFCCFLPHTSVYAIGVIAFDRYARMRFFNRYPVVVTKRKIIATCSVITFVSLCEGLLYAFGSKFNFFHVSRNFVHVIDFFVFASVVHVIDFFASTFAFAFASEQCDQPNIIAKYKQNYDNIGLKDSRSYWIFIWNLHSSSSCLHGVYKQRKEWFETMVKFCIAGYLITC